MCVKSIFPSGILKVPVDFCSTGMQEKQIAASEATLMATFSPEVSATRKATSVLNVPRIGVRFVTGKMTK